LVFVGINASIASDAGLLFTPTIGAAIFKSLGRNPWIGIIAGYAAASGGISASLFVSGSDIVLSGITESAASGIINKGNISPLMNWYFMVAATLVLTVVLTIFTEKFLVKVIGDTKNSQNEKEKSKYELTSLEKKGLRYTGVAFLFYIGIILYLSIPNSSFFRNDSGSFLPKSPLLSSILPLLFFLFFILGSAYGVGAKKIKTLTEIPKMMQKQMIGITGVLVTMLPASMFVYLFGVSKLAIIIAVNGADIIKKLDIGGIPLILLLVLLCTTLNLFMGSASAKWLILAPIFVPLFSMVGFSPALTQVAYRIGDGASNIISPIASAVPLIIGLLEQYKPEGSDKKVGVGTIIALELPFTFVLILTQVLMLIIWYMFDIPLGPGA
ncbi:MAG: AbgT family transporter, partial [Cetobacterium sp.]